MFLNGDTMFRTIPWDFLHCLVIREGSVFQLPDRISLYTDTSRLRQHYVLEDLVQVGIEYTCGQLSVYVCHC